MDVPQLCLGRLARGPGPRKDSFLGPRLLCLAASTPLAGLHRPAKASLDKPEDMPLCASQARLGLPAVIGLHK